MNERQGSSLAERQRPARGAVLVACAATLLLALGACGQKGPLYMAAPGGPAATPASQAPSTPAAAAPVTGASSPGLPPAAK